MEKKNHGYQQHIPVSIYESIPIFSPLIPNFLAFFEGVWQEGIFQIF